MCDPLLLGGTECVAGCPGICGFVCADVATANDNTAAAHVLQAIHFCIFSLREICLWSRVCNAEARSGWSETLCRRNQLAHVTGGMFGGVKEHAQHVRWQLRASDASELKQPVG